MPNGFTYNLTSTAGSTPQDKIARVNEILSTYMINGKGLSSYIANNWLSNVSGDSPQITPEDKVKSMLDKLGSYILKGQYLDGDIVTEYMDRQYKQAEIPSSNYYGDTVNPFYNHDRKDKGGHVCNGRDRITEPMDRDLVSPRPHKLPSKAVKRRKSKGIKYKDTRMAKMSRLPSCDYGAWVYAWGNVLDFDNKLWRMKPLAEYEQTPDGMSAMSRVLCRRLGTRYYFYNEQVIDISKHVELVD